MPTIRRASLKKTKVRLALCGPSKAGKTWKALSIGSSFLETLKNSGSLIGNGKIGGIDTEEASMDKYADEFEFYKCDIDTFSPEVYIDTIGQFAKEGYTLLVIDSISHEWFGKRGLLEFKSNLAATSGYNEFTAWNKATPKHNAFIEAMIRYPYHLFATVRAKMDYVLEENERGKQVPVKVGLGPIQRDSTEYEFDIFANVRPDHYLDIGGSRCRYLSDNVYGPDDNKLVGEILGKWVSETINLNELSENPNIPVEVVTELKSLGDQLGMTEGDWIQALSSFGVSAFDRLLPDDAQKILNRLKQRIEKKAK